MDPRTPSTPSPARASAFRVGRNSRGNWVAQDQDGLRGGLFISRAQAVRFALLANIHHPQDIIMVPDTLELDMQIRADAPVDELTAQQDAADRSIATLKRLHLVSDRPTYLNLDFIADDEQQDAPRKVANGR
jgi:hypothetical protein